MSRKCQITGKKSLSGHTVSKSHIKTKHWQKTNLQWKRIYDPELGRFVRLRISTSALRSITKMGLMPYLRKRGLNLKSIQ